MSQSISVFRTFAACLTMVALAAYAKGAFGQDVERSFSADEGDLVVVDVERAELNIVAWDRSEVSVSIQHAERYEFDFSQDDGVVTIHGEYDRPNILFGFFQPAFRNRHDERAVPSEPRSANFRRRYRH